MIQKHKDESSRPVLLVDGLNIFMRHFVVNPTMSDLGTHVGGAVGFLNSLKNLSTRIGPSEIVVVWEGGGSSRRRAIFKNYKNGRRPQRLNRYYKDDIPDTVENRDNQIALTIDLIRSTGIKQLYVSDCEADDIIAFLAKSRFKDRKIVVASSDKDLYQLLSKNVIQWSPGQKKFITLKDVKRKFNISSVNFCTARCFVGDPSDGLPGVPRAGFPTMAKRFPQLSTERFVSVEEIIQESKICIENSKVMVYNKIVENEEIAKRNWKLMYLSTKNLSESQVRKIDFQLSDLEQDSNKFSLIKKLSRSGIKNFDVDSFYIAVRSCLRSE